jgi:hypothetical protein
VPWAETARGRFPGGRETRDEDVPKKVPKLSSAHGE